MIRGIGNQTPSNLQIRATSNLSLNVSSNDEPSSTGGAKGIGTSSRYVWPPLQWTRVLIDLSSRKPAGGTREYYKLVLAADQRPAADNEAQINCILEVVKTLAPISRKQYNDGLHFLSPHASTLSAVPKPPSFATCCNALFHSTGEESNGLDSLSKIAVYRQVRVAHEFTAVMEKIEILSEPWTLEHAKAITPLSMPTKASSRDLMDAVIAYHDRSDADLEFLAQAHGAILTLRANSNDDVGHFMGEIENGKVAFGSRNVNKEEEVFNQAKDLYVKAMRDKQRKKFKTIRGRKRNVTESLFNDQMRAISSIIGMVNAYDFLEKMQPIESMTLHIETLLQKFK